MVWAYIEFQVDPFFPCIKADLHLTIGNSILLCLLFNMCITINMGKLAQSYHFRLIIIAAVLQCGIESKVKPWSTCPPLIGGDKHPANTWARLVTHTRHSPPTQPLCGLPLQWVMAGCFLSGTSVPSPGGSNKPWA